jgi:hypothetical protein
MQSALAAVRVTSVAAVTDAILLRILEPSVQAKYLLVIDGG